MTKLFNHQNQEKASQINKFSILQIQQKSNLKNKSIVTFIQPWWNSDKFCIDHHSFAPISNLYPPFHSQRLTSGRGLCSFAHSAHFYFHLLFICSATLRLIETHSTNSASTKHWGKTKQNKVTMLLWASARFWKVGVKKSRFCTNIRHLSEETIPICE